MADEPDDEIENIEICNGLNINISTLNSRTIESMFIAGKRASELGHILLLDPDGAGANKLLADAALNLLKQKNFDIIRGNTSEIKTLVMGSGTTHWVDADKADLINNDNLAFMVKFVKDLSKSLSCH